MCDALAAAAIGSKQSGKPACKGKDALQAMAGKAFLNKIVPVYSTVVIVNIQSICLSRISIWQYPLCGAVLP
jgi:hypothetical protein